MSQEPLCQHDNGCLMCAGNYPVSSCPCTTDHMHIVSDAIQAKDPPSYEQLVEAIQDLLSSAFPHPVEHPTMTAAWKRATALLERLTPSEPSAPGNPV